MPQIYNFGKIFRLTTSLIIATYNWPEALETVLKSAVSQSIPPDEILIADDGSSQQTADLIRKFQSENRVPIHHIWHEDKGFRLAEIRNKAIAKSQHDYIIQIDGDVILHRNFVKDHKNLAKKNCFITGSRVLLSPEFSKEILTEKQTKISPFSKGIKNAQNAIYFPIFNKFAKPENNPLEKMTTRIRGCNMSFWRQDLLEINGYDESFVGWGREDSDLVIRLIKKGCYRRKVKFAAVQYHLYHKENSKENLEKNHQILEEALKRKGFWAENGIVK
ncbi:glycosyltransferase family 2 protein [Cruoricaptor ignavus]|uniref:Glycosyltransferase family 2 protein n=1 Tax=Cruoricaptor ignavus TaxID=1118202 RepID=A0A7M1T0W6_9FLAO|nr:glycosyltransferase family 2 protein [Cruoricaptor ignavus]QOR73480.1 glycosyltransferase family 2 protein [Cruoricaptor ignavus]